MLEDNGDQSVAIGYSDSDSQTAWPSLTYTPGADITEDDIQTQVRKTYISLLIIRKMKVKKKNDWSGHDNLSF